MVHTRYLESRHKRPNNITIYSSLVNKAAWSQTVASRWHVGLLQHFRSNKVAVGHSVLKGCIKQTDWGYTTEVKHFNFKPVQPQKSQWHFQSWETPIYYTPPPLYTCVNLVQHMHSIFIFTALASYFKMQVNIAIQFRSSSKDLTLMSCRPFGSSVTNINRQILQSGYMALWISGYIYVWKLTSEAQSCSFCMRNGANKSWSRKLALHGLKYKDGAFAPWLIAATTTAPKNGCYLQNCLISSFSITQHQKSVPFW